MSPLEMEALKKDIFSCYRRKGFPYFELSQIEQLKVLERLYAFDSSSLVQDNVIKQVMLGLNLANYYMPHMWEVKCQSFRSPMETFLDDAMFRKTIEKRLSLGDNISDAGIRKALSWTHGTQRVSNFRPTVAKYIYDTYAGNGQVLDFSAGFGGRLLGAIVSSKVKNYVGFEPCLKTYNCLTQMNSLSSKGTIINQPFEDSILPQDYFDLAFSSPPYFNCEHYSDEPTQSYIRYPTQELWRDGFLQTLCQKCYTCLKVGGFFVINVANVKTYLTLEDDAMNLARKTGFKHIKTYDMNLSKLMGKGFKKEPIFVFQK